MEEAIAQLNNLTIEDCCNLSFDDLKDILPSNQLQARLLFNKYIKSKQALANGPFKKLLSKAEMVNVLSCYHPNNTITSQQIQEACHELGPGEADQLLNKFVICWGLRRCANPSTFFSMTTHHLVNDTFEKIIGDDYVKEISKILTPDLFIDRVRRNLINHICLRIHTWMSGGQITNREHLLVAGVRGVGKSTFFQKMIVSMDSFGLVGGGKHAACLLMVYVTTETILTMRQLLSVIVASTIEEIDDPNYSTLTKWTAIKGHHLIIVLDEAQSILCEPYPTGIDIEFIQKQKLELSSLSNESTLTLIITGSAQSLVEGAFHGSFITLNNDKLRPIGYSPICYSKEEYAEACKMLVPVDKPYPAIENTAGIIKNIIIGEGKPRYHTVQPGTTQSLVEYSILDHISRSGVNDYFCMEGVPVSTLINITGVNKKFLDELVDKQILLCRDLKKLSYTFLWPKYHEYMQLYSNEGLSFKEECAFFFPEGRTLGEVWESFRAENLLEEFISIPWEKFISVQVESSKEILFPSITIDQLPHLLQVRTCGIFKFTPDIYGFDLIVWKKFDSTVEVGLEQVKVGYKYNFIKETEVQLLLDGRGDAVVYKIMSALEKKDVKISQRLVKSRRMPKDLVRKLSKVGVEVHSAAVNTEWGSRVKSYCDRRGLDIFTKLKL